jgi:predicted Zn-dependent protease
MRRILTLFAWFLAAQMSIWATGSTASAAGLSLIRDAEIENYLQTISTPLLREAGLEPENVSFHIVQDKELNAFVAGGQRIFVTTGLLRSAESAGQVIGVLAHEIGHIYGGHLARFPEAVRGAQTAAIISQVLAAAVAILAQDGAAGAAASVAGASVAQQSVLQYSRTQERSADQAGLRFLEATGQSAKGLDNFLRKLEDRELLYSSASDQLRNNYLTTHPATRDRIIFIEQFLKSSEFANTPTKPEYQTMHRRVTAKLDGFLQTPALTLQRYKETDTSLPAQYARAVAMYRLGQTPEAIAAVDRLIADHPKDGYFYELKGQILFEWGKVAEAIPEYREAVRLLPNEPLIRTALAHALIETNNEENLQLAASNLEEALKTESPLLNAFKFAEIAYGRLGEMGKSRLMSAEYNFRAGKKEIAQKMAEAAQQLLKPNTPDWNRAADIEHLAKLDREN